MMAKAEGAGSPHYMGAPSRTRENFMKTIFPIPLGAAT